MSWNRTYKWHLMFIVCTLFLLGKNKLCRIWFDIVIKYFLLQVEFELSYNQNSKYSKDWSNSFNCTNTSKHCDTFELKNLELIFSEVGTSGKK